MAVLQSQTPPLGPIEALFTVNEEDGMDGALGLQPGLLQGTILINLDSETEGEFTIGSAGGEYGHIKAAYTEASTPDGMQGYQVTVSGLQGGHSGVNINLGRGHATKLLVRLLSVAAAEFGLRLAGITGGTAANAIPQEATALVAVPTAQADAFLGYVGEFQGIVQAELAATEPDLVVGATPVDVPAKVMAEDAQRTIIDALYGTPQGVLRMSDAVPDLVETSTNMGIVQGTGGELDVTFYPRSSVDSELDDVAQMIASVWDLGGIDVTYDGRYPGWKPNPDSPILALMQSVYHNLYGKDPNVVALHAGLECGVIQSKYPGMDAISIGPTLQDVHTPDERLEIATVQKLADLLTQTLVQIPSATAQPAEAPTPTSGGQSAPASGAGLPNPASQNCIQQGGTLAIEERGDGGQFGVCYFEDNMQCEEWALMRGDCPVGGLKVTGYVTPAARCCAITGGQYAVTGKSGANDEQGTCTFKDGSQCDAWDYYNGTCAASAGAEAASPGGAGLLVFDSTRGGEYRDLWVMSVDGTPPTRLTEGEANNFAGPWSPDGTRVVYTCGGLTTSDICIVNADGTGMLNLTDTPNVDEGFPAWSPDGEKIAFTTRRDGNNEIYEMPAPAPGASAAAASSKWVRLTDNPTDDFAPAWSPDGSQIAFVSDRDRKAGIYDIYIMQADGSGVRRLTADTAIDYSPAWSPDGKMIAFRSHHDGPADIYLIGVDGAGLHDLTNNPADDWAPQWSPDGTLIAFQTNRDGDWEIYTIHPDGSNSVNLTNDPAADDQLPFWRP
jgi:dipeptidase D